jgi:hypothetical protein
LFPLPKSKRELDFDGNLLPPKFEIKKFFGELISFEEDEQEFID